MGCIFWPRNLNLFPRNGQLTIDRPTTKGSLVSFTMSAIVIILLIALVIRLLIQFFDTSQPLKMIVHEVDDHYKPIDLYANQILPIVFAKDKNENRLSFQDFSSYYTLHGFKVKLDSENVVETVENSITFIPCKDYKTEQFSSLGLYDTTSTLFETVKRYGYCLDLPSTSLSLAYNEELSLQVRPCVSSSSKICSTPTENIHVGYLTVGTSVNHKDYSDNVQRNSNSPIPYIPIKDSSMQTLVFKALPSQIKNYNSWLSYWTTSKEFVGVEAGQRIESTRASTSSCTTENENLLSGQCESYVTWSMSLASEMRVFYRRYTTLGDIVATFGGTSVVIYCLCWLIVRLLTCSNEDSELLESVYPSMSFECLDLSSPKNSSAKATSKAGGGGCLKKKTPDQVAAENKRAKALLKIKECMNVKRIVHDSHLVYIMARILLEDRHIGLAYLAELKHDEKEKNTSNFREEKIKQGLNTESKEGLIKLESENPKKKAFENWRQMEKWKQDVVRSYDNSKAITKSIRKELLLTADSVYMDTLNIRYEQSNRQSSDHSSDQTVKAGRHDSNYSSEVRAINKDQIKIEENSMQNQKDSTLSNLKNKGEEIYTNSPNLGEDAEHENKYVKAKEELFDHELNLRKKNSQEMLDEKANRRELPPLVLPTQLHSPALNSRTLDGASAINKVVPSKEGQSNGSIVIKQMQKVDLEAINPRNEPAQPDQVPSTKKKSKGSSTTLQLPTPDQNQSRAQGYYRPSQTPPKSTTSRTKIKTAGDYFSSEKAEVIVHQSQVEVDVDGGWEKKSKRPKVADIPTKQIYLENL